MKDNYKILLLNYQLFDSQKEYVNLTSAQIEKMRTNNALDVVLYERALNDTNAALARQPPSFWNELAIFKQMQRGNFCTFSFSSRLLPPPPLSLYPV